MILILVSRDYVASDDYYENEILAAVARHQQGASTVIPIFTKSYLLSDEPFANLQGLPRRGGALANIPAPEREALVVEVALEIDRTIRNLRGELPSH